MTEHKIFKTLFRLKNVLKKNDGFSLVECVIAIAVFAIMSLILFGVLLKCVEQNGKNQNAAKAYEKQVESVINRSILGKTSVPTTLDKLTFTTADGDIVIETKPDYTIRFNNYFDDTAGFRLTKPVFDTGSYEYYLIFKNHAAVSEGSFKWYRFYSTVKIDPAEIKLIEQIPITEAGYNYVYDIELELNLTPNVTLPSSYVCLFKLQDNSSLLGIGTDDNSKVRIINGEKKGDAKTIIRVCDFKGLRTTVNVSFRYKSNDDFNLQNYFNCTTAAYDNTIYLTERSSSGERYCYK